MTRGAWRLPGYKVEALIGAGASGEVWRATVGSTGVPVALKRIWLSERAQRQAAISEAAILGELDHPHLMKLHDVRRLDDAIVLVLDLAAAGSLAALLDRRGRLTVGETITAIAPIGSALAYAHNAGVVHGDVSAANVLFTDIGLPLLADLGVARLLGDTAPVRTTPCYVDPAVATGAPPEPTSDVFMLGGVALHALTGTPPWPGGDAAEVFETAATTGVEPDWAGRLAAAGVPEAVRKVVVRALRLDPLFRGTAAEFALELRHAAEPVAVELAAGRTRRGTAMLESWPLESVPVATDQPASGSVRVPPFARAPLTAGVRAPTPFARPPSGRHASATERTGRRRLAPAVVAAAIVVVAAGVGTALWWPAAGRSQSRDVAATPRQTAPPLTSPATPPVEPRATTVHQPDRVASVLADLDARRAQAFARRDPAALRGVYASPTLLARDRALLISIVPRGCGLYGVRSRFAAIRVTRRGARLRVRTVVTVHPSDLRCGGTRAGRAGGTQPVTTTLDLVRTDDGYRIAAEHT
ncbi:MAG TPA: protein kinase [Jatrophihabitans sp.]|jgi:hypothetical protein